MILIFISCYMDIIFSFELFVFLDGLVKVDDDFILFGLIRFLIFLGAMFKLDILLLDVREFCLRLKEVLDVLLCREKYNHRDNYQNQNYYENGQYDSSYVWTINPDIMHAVSEFYVCLTTLPQIVWIRMPHYWFHTLCWVKCHYHCILTKTTAFSRSANQIWSNLCQLNAENTLLLIIFFILNSYKLITVSEIATNAVRPLFTVSICLML